MLRLGTKWPSITSTWMRFAPAASTVRTSSPRREKSAERIEGAIIVVSRFGFRVSSFESVVRVVLYPRLGDRTRNRETGCTTRLETRNPKREDALQLSHRPQASRFRRP